MSIVGAVWGMLSDTQQNGVLDDAAHEGSERYQLYFDTALKAAAGGRKPPWRDRLVIFRTRPQDAWAAMQAEFPKEWQQQQKEWIRLEEEHGHEVPRVTQAPIVPPPPQAAGPAWAPTVQDALAKAEQKQVTRQIEGEYSPQGQ